MNTIRLVFTSVFIMYSLIMSNASIAGEESKYFISFNLGNPTFELDVDDVNEFLFFNTPNSTATFGSVSSASYAYSIGIGYMVLPTLGVEFDIGRLSDTSYSGSTDSSDFLDVSYLITYYDLVGIGKYPVNNFSFIVKAGIAAVTTDVDQTDIGIFNGCIGVCNISESKTTTGLTYGFGVDWNWSEDSALTFVVDSFDVDYVSDVEGLGRENVTSIGFRQSF